MESNNSRGKVAASSVILNATKKMKICLDDLHLLSDVANSFPEHTLQKIEEQMSIKQVQENMKVFQQHFHKIEDFLDNVKKTFYRQMQIILNDDLNSLKLSVDCDPNDTEKDQQLFEDSEKVCDVKNDKPVSQSKEIDSVADCVDSKNRPENCVIVNKPLESTVNLISNEENLSQTNSENCFDSSNDLPEAKENASKQTPDSSNMKDTSGNEEQVFRNDSDQTEFNDNENMGGSGSVIVTSTEPEMMAEKTINKEPECNRISTSIESQVSESLLHNTTSILFDESIINDPIDNPPAEEKDKSVHGSIHSKLSGENKENEEASRNSEHDIEESNVSLNEKQSSSEKVKEWLNKSLDLEGDLSLDIDANKSGNLEVNKSLDSQTLDPEILLIEDDSNAKEPVSDSETVILEQNDAKVRKKESSSGADLPNEDHDPVSEMADNKSQTTSYSNDNNEEIDQNFDPTDSRDEEEVIDISDDEEVSSAHLRYFGFSSKDDSSPDAKKEKGKASVWKCKKNPNVTITPINFVPVLECVDVVQLDENDGLNDDDCCVINGDENAEEPFNDKSSVKSELKDDLSDSERSSGRIPVHSLSDSDNADVTLINNNSSSSSEEAGRQEKSTSMDNEEAKRKLLASSSSTSASLGSSEWESPDSDTTVKVKSKKYKKKRKKLKASGSSLGNTTEGNSTDSEAEIARLGDLRSLKRKKIIRSNSDEKESTDGSVETKPKKRKKNPEPKEDEVHFSSDSIFENFNCPEEEEFNLSVVANNENDLNKEPETDIFREMLLEQNSSSESCIESSQSPPKKEKKKKKPANTSGDESDEIQLSDSGSGSTKKAKKRKYDPLLNCKLSTSDSCSDTEPSKKNIDEKYNRILERKEEKNKLQKVQKDIQSDTSCGNSDNDSEGGMNFVSCDPECVEISPSEDENTESEDDCVLFSDAASVEDDDIQALPLSQTSTISAKVGRKNIRKVMTTKDLTEESKRAAKEEEERLKRLSEKEKLFSQTFSEPEVGKLVLDFDKDTKEELVCVHQELVRVLKEHQVAGVKFMWNTCFESVERTQNTEGSGCVIAHCMGLGKSLQVVTLVHTLLNHPELKMRNILIVCPKSVLKNWRQEFSIWLDRIEMTDRTNKKVNIFDLIGFDGYAMKEMHLKRWHDSGGVMIMSYGNFRATTKPFQKNKKTKNGEVNESVEAKEDGWVEKMKKYLQNPGPDVIICDEGHMLKNNNSNIAKVMTQVRTKRRIILTGTPMQNNLLEYYVMVNFVKPNYLGDLKEFRNQFLNPINNGQYEDSTPQDVRIMKRRAHVLHKKLGTIVQRFDSNLLESHLPKKYEYILKIRLTPIQIRLYIGYLDKCKSKMDDRNSTMLRDCEVLTSNICNHPLALIDTNGSGQTNGEKSEEENEWKKWLDDVDLNDVKFSWKCVLFFEILNLCKETGDKLLLFSHSLKTLDIIEDFLKKLSKNKDDIFVRPGSDNKENWIPGKDYFRLDGSTSMQNRSDYIRYFNNPRNTRARLFLLSSKAGGQGINLTGANRAIIFDVSWNPSIDAQSVYRIYRYGQTKVCYIYRFVTKGTMEEKQFDRQISKLSTTYRVVDEHQIDRHYQQNHLQEMYQYDFDYDKAVRLTPKVPADKILAELLKKPDCIVNYEEHDLLLKNILDEELDEDERRKAWEDYENEKNAPPKPLAINGPSTSTPSTSAPSTSNPTAGMNGVDPSFWYTREKYLEKYPHLFSHMANNFNRNPNIPVANQNVPRAYQNVPRAYQNVPRVNQNVPNANQNIPNANQNVPNTNQNVPNANQNVPNANRNVPVNNAGLNFNIPNADDKLRDLLKKNIIPLPYEPLSGPSSRSSRIPTASESLATDAEKKDNPDVMTNGKTDSNESGPLFTPESEQHNGVSEEAIHSSSVNVPNGCDDDGKTAEAEQEVSDLNNSVEENGDANDSQIQHSSFPNVTLSAIVEDLKNYVKRRDVRLQS